MGDQPSGLSSTILSASAFIVLALAAAAGSVWCASAASIAHSDIGKYGERAAGHSGAATGGLVLFAVGLGAVALVLFGLAVWAIKLGLTDFRTPKSGSPDDSWKNMPFPKG